MYHKYFAWFSSQLDGAAVTVFMFDFTGRSEDEVSLKELAQVRQGGVHVVVSFPSYPVFLGLPDFWDGTGQFQKICIP